MGSFVDLTGKRFGRLTVVALAGRNAKNRILWECLCDCGQTRLLQNGSLQTGHTKSCGCQIVDSATKHGFHSHRLYPVWRSMLARCQNENCAAYPQYGGRGIEVCDRWQDVATFIVDMLPSYTEGMTLDRIDNDAGYSPENCRWATRAVQSRNRSDNRFIEFNGERMCLSDWAAKCGFPIRMLHARLKRGWSIEKALTTPHISRGHKTITSQEA